MNKYICAVIILGVIGIFSLPAVSDASNQGGECLNLTSVLQYSSVDRTTNGEVSKLQKFLADKGLLNSEPTGFYGLLTTAAVRQYQRSLDLFPVGSVGPLTKGVIKRETCNDSGSVEDAETHSTVCTMEARMCPDGSVMPRDSACVWHAEQCSAEKPAPQPCASGTTWNGSVCTVTIDYPQVSPGNYSFSFVTSDSLTRSYTVHIPTGYTPSKAYPVVVALHGGFGSASSFEMSTSMSNYADERGFIVVYGQGSAWGTPPTTMWNGGTCCGQAADAFRNVDDVGYVRSVVTQIQAKYHIQGSRIYATGMSNGSMLAHRLACEASDIFAGIAGVSGTISKSPCTPARQIPILIIHGTADTNVPYDGGKGLGVSNVSFISVSQEFGDWSTRNTCSGALTITSIPPLATTGTTADKIENTACRVPVVLYRINGGAHEWPRKALNASKTILDFFGLN